MAHLEKALLDYCYLHPNLKSVEDFEAVRLNATLLRDCLDQHRLRAYLSLFNSKQLTQRISTLSYYINFYA